ncbi:MAG: response regulator [Candidatus Pacebacteria bacterium]|nr:response regulator [Candidatus Paceibacterota bacterium]
MANTKKKTILLVEDDPFLIDIYSTKFLESGFSVEIIKSGDLILPRLEEITPDLIVLDIVLPQMDGWEILRRIKSEKRFKDLKVIILSNLGQKEEVEKGMKLGATKYLIKAHFTPSQIAEEVKKILD